MEALKNSEHELSDEVFMLLADLIYAASGIRICPAKKNLLVSRLLRRLRLTGAGSFYAYYHLIKDDPLERIEMLNAVSTHTTMFFRERYHFDFLARTVLPRLATVPRDSPMRIWSAGCATGEEAYSLAITVSETLRAHSRQDIAVRILATDMSTSVLETAEEAVYEEAQLPDEMGKDILHRYFLKGTGENTGTVRIKDTVRELVTFRRLNLKDRQFPFSKPFDVIFCRNVMIYFDEAMKRHALGAFHRHLADWGTLFLGHAENMIGQEMFNPVSITAYQKKLPQP